MFIIRNFHYFRFWETSYDGETSGVKSQNYYLCADLLVQLSELSDRTF
jgi:hypothetical protein